MARVAEVVGRALVGGGIDHVFGVVGSGNFHVTNAMVSAGARYVAARHEGGAATMADAYVRTTGKPAAITVHQGCGLTNAMTGITEAAKSRTPLVVVAAEATEPRSNFYVDQEALAVAVGALSFRVDDADSAARVARDAVHTAVTARRTVVLNLPLGVQAMEASEAVPSVELVETTDIELVDDAPPSVETTSGAKPAPKEAHTSAELMEQLTGTAVDSPLCMTCGTKMRPAGSCYVCEGCGSTSGCS
jgi:thiamine pyrophosphate-dependent acetolactate synthase large subunit-like protein